MKFSEFKNLHFATFYKPGGGLPVILPFVGYIIFGVCNIYFFSLAIKQLPTATAYAVWTAATLIMIKIAEITFFQQRFSLIELFFITLIMTGILGLKFYGTSLK
ncbi:SMR family transporter [Mucilaginibacter sp. BT774]|nr:SMR family transporter [Mucilaginibacter sp. BT774]MDO3626290.1 SMR family transporter [Mucilaginibacter sp. BT774]